MSKRRRAAKKERDDVKAPAVCVVLICAGEGEGGSGRARKRRSSLVDSSQEDVQVVRGLRLASWQRAQYMEKAVFENAADSEGTDE